MELQARLTQLIGYSSQLIFIGCNKIAQQQSYLNQFLSNSADNAEVSFFNASENNTPADHRRTICRQLFNHQIGSYTRSLSELTKDQLHNHQVYLVCISRAELLSSDFLLELWQWVSSNREKQSNTHLNILLFSEQKWANAMQEWLPNQQQQPTVLLSSEPVDAVGFDVNALESLMAERRAFFGEHGALSKPETNRINVQNKWFITSVLSVFLIVFVGIMSLQYPQHAHALITGNSMPSADDKSDISEIAYTLEATDQKDQGQSIDDIQISDHELVDLQQEFSEASLDSSVIETGTTDSDLAVIIDSADIESAEQTPVTDELLVAKWQPTQHSEKIQSPYQDFQVPDILSVEQLDNKLEEIVPDIPVIIDSREESITETASAPDVAIADNIVITPELDLNDYRFDEELLMQLPKDQLVLQLSGMQSREVLDQFITRNNLGGKSWIYETVRNGNRWFVLLHNDTFSSARDALSTINDLPNALQRVQPFAKSVGQIRSEISKVNY